MQTIPLAISGCPLANGSGTNEESTVKWKASQKAWALHIQVLMSADSGVALYQTTRVRSSTPNPLGTSTLQGNVHTDRASLAFCQAWRIPNIVCSGAFQACECVLLQPADVLLSHHILVAKSGVVSLGMKAKLFLTKIAIPFHASSKGLETRHGTGWLFKMARLLRATALTLRLAPQLVHSGPAGCCASR